MRPLVAQLHNLKGSCVHTYTCYPVLSLSYEPTILQLSTCRVQVITLRFSSGIALLILVPLVRFIVFDTFLAPFS